MISLTPLEIDALVLSLRVGVWSLVICLPTGLLIALILARWKFPGKWLLDGIVHLPLVLPPVAIGYALLILLGRARDVDFQVGLEHPVVLLGSLHRTHTSCMWQEPMQSIASGADPSIDLSVMQQRLCIRGIHFNGRH